jgi:molecular chaperone HscA
MKLYDISEPDEPPFSSPKNELVVGIDLGTTNSLIAVAHNQKVTVIKDEASGKSYTPSVVAYLDRDNVLVGEKAYAHTGRYIASIKRLMGKGKGDLDINFPHQISKQDGVIRVKINDYELSPVEISAEILKSLKVRAEDYLKQKISKAVITVPAYFDDSARQATKDAAMLAGLEVVRLINEPTAAAVAYGFDQQPQGLYAIYDLGGGTFDISILQLQSGIFQVLATGGDTNLGGDDFDYLIVNHLQSKFHLTRFDPFEAKQEARAIKESLTLNNKWQGEFLGTACQITTQEFNQLIKPLVDKTIRIFKGCIKDAEISLADIKEIILVGGATRIPLIKNTIKQVMGKAPLDNINPDEIVVVGAAYQAEALTTGSNNLLIDVIPLSLGIEVASGIVEHIMPRNTAIPAVSTQTFTTQADNQNGIKVHVVQGESNEVAKCRSLARLELKNLPALPAGVLRVVVSFQVDADGILTVKAKDLMTNQMQEVLVKPSYGLSEEEIKKLLNN